MLAHHDTRYRELDFVGLLEEVPQLICEIKFSAKKHGGSQVAKSVGIAKSQWPDVRGVAICVRHHRVWDSSLSLHPSTVSVDNVIKLANESTDEVVFLDIDGLELIDAAACKGWINENFLPNLKRARNELMNPMSIIEDNNDLDWNLPFSDQL